MRIFSLFALLHTQALERQKEFFDSIRSERDDLREEVVMLKEELKVGNQRTVKKQSVSATTENSGTPKNERVRVHWRRLTLWH